MSDTTATEVPEQQDPSVALERVVGQLRESLTDLSYDELLRKLSPAVAASRALVVAPDLPVVSPLSDATKAALTKLPLVFAKIVPDTVRKLEPEELDGLLEERYVLDEIEGTIKKRKESIRSAVCNHLDTEHADDANLERDDKGHVLIKERIIVAKQPKCFSLELRSDAPEVTAEALKAVADDPDFDGFTHDDYLEMTTPVRVVDEHKTMLRLRKDPTLLRALAEATRPGKTTASLYLRKA
jgi:hypothetical protein